MKKRGKRSKVTELIEDISKTPVESLDVYFVSFRMEEGETRIKRLSLQTKQGTIAPCFGKGQCKGNMKIKGKLRNFSTVSLRVVEV